jgi:hypothetical protein
VANRGSDAAELHVLPTLWFRNTWTWWPDQPKPSLRRMPGGNTVTIETSHAELGGFLLHCGGNPRLLFTENDTNNERLFGTANATSYVKDGINDHVVAGRQDAVNPAGTRTKAAANYRLTVAVGATEVIRLRLSNAASRDPFGSQFEQQPAAAQLGKHVARIAASPALDDEPTVAIAERQRRIAIVMCWAAARPPPARAMPTTECRCDFGRGHWSIPRWRRISTFR